MSAMYGAQERSRPWRNDGEFYLWRVITAARVFALATILGLAAVTGDVTSGATGFLALCVLAAIMSLPMPQSSVLTWAPVAEAALAALIIDATAAAGAPLYVYLAIPTLVAGMQRGAPVAVSTAAAECFAVLGAGVASHQTGELAGVMELAGPWMLGGIGLGLLGAWIRANNRHPSVDQVGYESAHRLLAQLRAVSRSLSSGLDTSALADQILQHTLDATAARSAAILVRVDGTRLAALASKGDRVPADLETDPCVEACWQSQAPKSRPVGAESHRTAVPLRVGSRMIGVVVFEGTAAVDKTATKTLRTYLGEHSLRLETALLFDEVRSTATLEERNRVAREIHDGIAQEIASLGYMVDDLAEAPSASETKQLAQDLRRELSRLVSELRFSIFDLRSSVSTHGGLGLALSDYAREVGRRAGLTVHLALSEQPQRLHVSVETELLRIAQEAMTNARKHARALNLWVTLNTESPIVMLRIEDDGIGSVEARADHFGLHMMHERAQRVGGGLVISQRPRGGTSVVVSVWPQNNSSTGDRSDNLSLAC
jgi:signal transduction histidine kinase